MVLDVSVASVGFTSSCESLCWCSDADWLVSDLLPVGCFVLIVFSFAQLSVV
jgi:hypothetical protein